MIPMIDALMVVPGSMDAMLSVGPAFVGVLAAVVFGAAWVARGTAEELRRIAVRDWEGGTRIVAPTPDGRIAA